MQVKELISDLVPPLKTSDTGLKALSMMEIFRISHLPIVNNTEFLGLISDNDIYDMNMADEPIGNHKLSLFSPYVTDSQHVFEAIELVNRMKLTVVPVLDDQKKYLGLILMNDLIHYFAEFAGLKNPGGIIVIEMNTTDYSLTEIANIIEGNEGKILAIYISQPDDSTKIEVTIKVNRTEISPFIQTFNRYNYDIKATYMESGEMNNLFESRYESFMRYLNI